MGRARNSRCCLRGMRQRSSCMEEPFRRGCGSSPGMGVPVALAPHRTGFGRAIGCFTLVLVGTLLRRLEFEFARVADGRGGVASDDSYGHGFLFCDLSR